MPLPPLPSARPSLNEPIEPLGASARAIADTPDWATPHLDLANEVYTQVRTAKAPMHIRVLKPNIPPRVLNQDPFVRERLALRPPPHPCNRLLAPLEGQGFPKVPEMVVARPPSMAYDSLAMFMLHLKQEQARHVVVLGDLDERWLPQREEGPKTCTQVCQNSTMRVLTSAATPFGTAQKRSVEFHWEFPDALRHTDSGEPSARVSHHHRIDLLQVSTPTPDMLGPSELRDLTTWVFQQVNPQEPVILLGRDHLPPARVFNVDPQLAMSGQVAATMALRQVLPQLGALSEQTQAVQQELLLSVFDDLFNRHPVLLGGPTHLAAVLAASEPVPFHRLTAVPA